MAPKGTKRARLWKDEFVLDSTDHKNPALVEPLYTRAGYESSTVWKVFRWLMPKKEEDLPSACVVCTLCDPLVKQAASGTTSNLLRHIRERHKDLLPKVEPKLSAAQTGPRSTFGLLQAQSQVGYRNASEMAQCYVAFRGNRPLSIIQSPEWIAMAKTLSKDPNFKVPDPRTVLARAHSQANALREDVSGRLAGGGSVDDIMFSLLQIKAAFKKAGVKEVIITTDGWTGRNQKDFLALVAHWLDDEWVCKFRCLGVVKIHGLCHASLTPTLALACVLSVTSHFSDLIAPAVLVACVRRRSHRNKYCEHNHGSVRKV